VREILLKHSDAVEPLSLDEAYLDVSTNKTGLASATDVARAIRAEIRETLSLTASAGVAPNKFLAKIASDWRKPDGLFVIRPEQVDEFLLPLPVGRLPGVGAVMERRLGELGISTVGELRGFTADDLVARFGRYGQRLFGLARGIDRSEVRADRPTMSVSAEDTFESDRLLEELDEAIIRLAAKAWAASRKVPRAGRTVVLKLKTADFRTLTRSQTPEIPPEDCERFTRIALDLRQRVQLAPDTRYRLVGVGLSNFGEREVELGPQAELFTESGPIEPA
jgi:DNA polymerase-4